MAQLHDLFAIPYDDFNFDYDDDLLVLDKPPRTKELLEKEPVAYYHRADRLFSKLLNNSIH